MNGPLASLMCRGRPFSVSCILSTQKLIKISSQDATPISPPSLPSTLFRTPACSLKAPGARDAAEALLPHQLQGGAGEAHHEELREVFEYIKLTYQRATPTPGEQLAEQAEHVSAKRMSWTDVAARLAPLAGSIAAVGGIAAGRIYGNRQAAE